MNEVEESNDDYRRRKVRLLRGIRKMRLERAFLLETLAKRMKKSGSAHGGFNFPYDEDSDTTDGPPTVSLTKVLGTLFMLFSRSTNINP